MVYNFSSLAKYGLIDSCTTEYGLAESGLARSVSLVVTSEMIADCHVIQTRKPYKTTAPPMD